MTRQQEAKELISQWVLEGKELEDIERDFGASPLAGALSPAALEAEYYASRTARKINQPPDSKVLPRVIGSLAILGGLGSFAIPFFIGELAKAARIPLYLLGSACIFLGLILVITPARAFEKD